MQEKGKLEFKPTPHCCGKELGNGWPSIICATCHTEYNADDMLDAMLAYRAGAKELPTVRSRPAN